MTPFITYREANEKGQLEYFILQKAFPNFIGRIVVYPEEGSVANVPITDYHLYVTFAGVLTGNFIPAHPNVKQEIEEVYSRMADWYYHNRVSVDEKKWKKWKIIK